MIPTSINSSVTWINQFSCDLFENHQMVLFVRRWMEWERLLLSVRTFRKIMQQYYTLSINLIIPLGTTIRKSIKLFCLLFEMQSEGVQTTTCCCNGGIDKVYLFFSDSKCLGTVGAAVLVVFISNPLMKDYTLAKRFWPHSLSSFLLQGLERKVEKFTVKVSWEYT